MSEQYRCNKCGYVLDMKDMMCSECDGGYFEHLRWTKGGDGSHWEGCEDVHWDCRIAHLEKELARLTALVERLKEDAERLADGMIISPENEGDFCSYCGGMEHVDDCPITLHRALIAELEKETEK